MRVSPASTTFSWPPSGLALAGFMASRMPHPLRQRQGLVMSQRIVILTNRERLGRRCGVFCVGENGMPAEIMLPAVVVDVGVRGPIESCVDDCPDHDSGGLAVADFPHSEYDLMHIKRAGDMIACELKWTRESEAEIRQAFHIANNWRESHAYPMRSIRGSLRWYMHYRDIEGVTVARLKRMQAIRRKLGRTSIRLHQFQDLGGCRAILSSLDHVHRLVETMRQCRHELRSESDYIARPKPDGYRSHHLMFNFQSRGDSKIFDGKRIEVQIRTRLQHAWATAVESVGLFRGEYLKGDVGDPQWLRLFQLMSAEFALFEGCPEPPGVPSHVQRIPEIIALDKALEATKNLDKLSHAVRFTDISVSPRERPTYYLIKYDNATNEITVETFFAPKSAMASYGSAEFFDNKTGRNTKNVVLVEADKVETLKEAYPNYFGDVQLFRAQLRNITKGAGVKEYTLKPQESVRPRPGENPDLTWLKRRIRWTEVPAPRQERSRKSKRATRRRR
jgi:ppGpp synthetase/RelA/SpoT-type nucleotidyltranferase